MKGNGKTDEYDLNAVSLHYSVGERPALVRPPTSLENLKLVRLCPASTPPNQQNALTCCSSSVRRSFLSQRQCKYLSAQICSKAEESYPPQQAAGNRTRPVQYRQVAVAIPIHFARSGKIPAAAVDRLQAINEFQKASRPLAPWRTQQCSNRSGGCHPQRRRRRRLRIPVAPPAGLGIGAGRAARRPEVAQRHVRLANCSVWSLVADQCAARGCCRAKGAERLAAARRI